MKSKHWTKSKINITQILICVITLASIADRLPPQFSKLAAYLTLAGGVATIIFRTFYTTKTLKT